MANPYPATFIDQNAEGRLVGELDFTDPANRPGGGSSVIGTSVLWATGAAVSGLPANNNGPDISYTLDSLLGSDLAIDGGDPTHVNVLTTGWYVIAVHLGINGTGPTSMKLEVNVSPDPAFGDHNYDDYVGADAINFGGCDLTVTTPPLLVSAGSYIRTRTGSDGTGTWAIESGPNSILVVRMA